MPEKTELANNAEIFLQRMRDEAAKIEREISSLQVKLACCREAIAALSGEMVRHRRQRAAWPAPVPVPDDEPPTAA